MPTRMHWQVTLNVWWALFIREAQQRILKDRFGWFWLIVQPTLAVIMMVAVRGLVMGKSTLLIAGAEWIPWLIVGLLTFQMFREVGIRSLNVVTQNGKLFTYRQVKPIDPVLVIGFVEGTLNTFVLLLFITFSLLLPFDLIPKDPVGVLLAWFLMWMIGYGFGLIFSVLSVLIPEMRKIVPMLMMPLFLTSGVIFPVNFLPAEMLQWLLWNPLLHVSELSRLYFFSSYQPVAGVNWMYPGLWAQSMLFLGFLLHLRYEQRLKTL